MKKAQLGFTQIEPSDSSHFNIHYDAIKAKFIAGEYVRVIDYPVTERQDVISVIAVLRDKLPIVSRWVVIRQSYLSEIRTKAIRYHIPQTFLQEGSA